MARSFLAVFAGYATFVAGIVAVFAGIFSSYPGHTLHELDPSSWPPPWVMAVIVTADVVLGVIAGLVTALVARRSVILHSSALGVVMIFLALASMPASSVGEPTWYRWSHVVIPLPATVLGGWLRSRKRGATIAAVGV